MVDVRIGVEQIKFGELKDSWTITSKIGNEPETILTMQGFRQRSIIQPSGIMVWHKRDDAILALERFLKDLADKNLVQSFEFGVSE
jgi:hypothetical protein